MIPVKICGLQNTEDLNVSIKYGASWGGLVFYNKSIRSINILKGKELAKHSQNRLAIVALFVNPKESLIDNVITNVKPDLIQFHGYETPEMCKDVFKRFGIPIIKAIQVSKKEDLKIAKLYSGKVNKILFDTKLDTNKLLGKSKKTIDWNIFKNLDINNEWILAGGLNINNIKNAISISKAKAIDISSGVESKPGKKNSDLIKNFLSKVKIMYQGN